MSLVAQEIAELKARLEVLVDLTLILRILDRYRSFGAVVGKNKYSIPVALDSTSKR